MFTVHVDFQNAREYCVPRVNALRIDNGWTLDEIITLAEKGGLTIRRPWHGNAVGVRADLAGPR